MTLEKALRRALALAGLAMLAVAFQLHYRIISYPWPLQTAEGAMPASTDRLLRHENPYDFASRPACANAYGILYPLSVAPLAALAPRWTLQIHRGVTAFFMALCGAMFFFGALKLGAGRFLALFIALNFYCCELFFGGPLARPDALGQCLFLGSLGLALFYGQSRLALAAACAMSTAAFFAKPYFVLASPMIFLWLLCQGRARAALAYGALALALAIGAGFAAAKLGEAYFYETVLIPMLYSGYDGGHMMNQLRWIFTHFQPGLAPALAATGLMAAAAKTAGPEDAPRRARVFGLIFFASAGTLFFVFKFGGHTGNFGTYYMQLAFPFLLLLVIPFRREWRLESGLCALLLLNSGFALRETPALPAAAAEIQQQEWNFMEAMIQRAGVDHALLGSDWAPWLAAHGRRPYDGGQMKYYDRFALPGGWWRLRLFPRCGEAAQIYESYQARLRGELNQRSYRLVIGNEFEFDRAALEANYDLQAKMPVSFYRIGLDPLEVWTPKAPGNY